MLTEDQIMEALHGVIDPEIGINIVDLGLIYNLDIKNDSVVVTMTLTTPGCPMHSSMAEGVERAIKHLEPNLNSEVNLVWEPKWTPDMMTDYAKDQLGF